MSDSIGGVAEVEGGGEVGGSVVVAAMRGKQIRSCRRVSESAFAAGFFLAFFGFGVRVVAGALGSVVAGSGMCGCRVVRLAGGWALVQLRGRVLVLEWRGL